MATVENAMTVYNFIWQYLTEHEELPTLMQIMNELKYSRLKLIDCIQFLREAKRISPTTLMPTAYSLWWHERRDAEQTWKQPSTLALSSYGRLVKRKANGNA